MTARKSSKTDGPAPSAPADAGEPTAQREQHDLEQGGGIAPAAYEQGYQGDRVDPLDDQAHSLESGPDAPVLNAGTA